MRFSWIFRKFSWLKLARVSNYVKHQSNHVEGEFVEWAILFFDPFCQLIFLFLNFSIEFRKIWMSSLDRAQNQSSMSLGSIEIKHIFFFVNNIFIFIAYTIFHQFALKIVQVFEKMSENFEKTFFFFFF